MKFVILFGPLAVGKMTVGQELEKITGLKLFHNHMTIELVLPFFEMYSSSFNKLVNSFRMQLFEEVAKRIIEITSDSILVAHNAQFDYRILQLEFKRLGFDFSMKSICTVILSQELLPNQESYKLGRLSRSLGIPLKDRHRASGDALATVELLKILIEKDINQEIIKKSIVEFPGESISDIFKKTIETLENTTGVFYIYNKKNRYNMG